MRALGLLLGAAACGGSQKPPPPVTPEVHVSAKPTTRVPVDDDREPDDGVQISDGRGHMAPDAVQAGISPHGADLSACYMSRVGARRWLGGKVVLHWDIKASGEVAAVKLAESDLGSWPVEKCLLEIARSATFARPVGGDAEFAVPLEFSAKGAPQIWDEDQGLKAIGGQVAKLDHCAKGKTTMPNDVTVTLYVGPHGMAQSVGFSSDKTVIESAWADCAEKAALSWRLPDPRGKVAKVAVRYRPR